MPIKIKFTDINFGDIFYLINDPDQFPHILTGIVILPGNQIKFILSYMGDESYVWDIETSREPNNEMIRKDID